MKHFFTLLIGCLGMAGLAQNTAVEVKNQDLSQLMGNVTEFRTYSAGDFRINVATVQNGSGSAATPGTDESDSSLYISICGSGERPDCKLYKVEHLMAVHVDKVSEGKTGVNVIITYGNYNQKKSGTIVIRYPAP